MVPCPFPGGILYFLVKLMSSPSILGKVIAIFPQSKMAAAAILFARKLRFWPCTLLWSVILLQHTVLNLIRICPSTAKKLHFDEIKNGGYHHLQFFVRQLSGHAFCILPKKMSLCKLIAIFS